MLPEVRDAIANGATRVLFVGGTGTMTEEIIAEYFARFGDIENVVVKPQKGIAFVNMTSVKSAMAVVKASELGQLELNGRKLNVNYSKEGVPARDPRKRVEELYAQYSAPPPPPPGAEGGYNNSGYNNSGYNNSGYSNSGYSNSRSIFLGDIPEDATNSDIGKIANRYGPIESFRIYHDKHNAFLNFVDPASAAALHAAASQRPLSIRGRRLKVGWGKSVEIRPDLLESIRKGATRNLFIGNLPENCTPEQLKEALGPYTKGEYDSVSVLSAKRIAFVNLTSIRSAVSAKIQLSKEPVTIDGHTLKVNYAKEAAHAQAPSHSLPPPPMPYAPVSVQQPPPRRYASPSPPPRGAPRPPYGRDPYGAPPPSVVSPPGYEPSMYGQQQPWYY